VRTLTKRSNGRDSSWVLCGTIRRSLKGWATESMDEHVLVLLQGIPFSLTLYSLLLIGLDVVLGIQWVKLLKCNL
jgi:hypothetical protein